MWLLPLSIHKKLKTFGAVAGLGGALAISGCNFYDLHGNFVVIDHENGEYSLMAHLIPGSLTVRKGQRVEAGSQLGLCGNSGQTNMPHLHWQVMNNAQAHLAKGVPPRYLPYERNGSTTESLPDRGDIVESP